MKLLSKLLGSETPVDKILKKQTSIDPRVCPTALIQYLKRGQMRSFIKKINYGEPTPLLALRKLSVVHYLLIHSPQLSEAFADIELKVVTKDQWLNENVLNPYGIFLYKIINAGDLYAHCKFRGVLQISFKMLFYVINTLYELFPCVKRMSSLQRYYQKVQKDLNTTATTDFVMIHAYQAQELYNCFKAILCEMMHRPQVYLKTENDTKMIKYVLDQVVFKLNEDMKSLFLDKFYFPYGKGFGVKLIRPDEMTGSTQTFIENIHFKEYEARMKRPKKKKTLDNFLFDESGRLNPEIYMTLNSIRNGDDSIRGPNAKTTVALRKHDDYELTQDI